MKVSKAALKAITASNGTQGRGDAPPSDIKAVLAFFALRNEVKQLSKDEEHPLLAALPTQLDKAMLSQLLLNEEVNENSSDQEIIKAARDVGAILSRIKPWSSCWRQ